MHVLTTAGHVDHGKSTFLRASTGMEPSRLKTERERNMSIELGYVWLKSKAHGTIGLVDVPGHTDFRQTMIAGTGRTDGFLFFVAANDGWMPQSEDHLWTLKMLGINRGMVIVTKCDLADSDSIETTEELLREYFQSHLGNTPSIFRYRKDEPIDSKILEGLENLCEGIGKPEETSHASLVVDRTFVKKGHGLVATGTLRGAPLVEKHRVYLIPENKPALARSLMSYGESKDEVAPTARVAIQFSDFGREKIDRGTVICSTKISRLSRQCDARLCFHPEFKLKNAKNRTVLILHEGKKLKGNLRFLADNSNNNKSQKYVRLSFMRPTWIKFGASLVILSSGGDRFIGAARIIDEKSSGKPSPDNLSSVNQFTLDEYINYNLTKSKFFKTDQFFQNTSFTAKEISELLKSKRYTCGNGYFLAHDSFNELQERALEELEKWHLDHPFAEGLEQTKLDKLLEVPINLIRLITNELKSRGKITQNGPHLKLVGYQAPISRGDSELGKRLDELSSDPTVRAYSHADLLVETPKDRELVDWYVQQNRMVRLDKKHVMSSATYKHLSDKISTFLHDNPDQPVAAIRDQLEIGRKLLILVLEKMDRDKLTFFDGKVRRMKVGTPNERSPEN